MVQILEALAYINSRHIIHRDVTTKNILILECGTCKLCDFGEACQWDYGGVSGVCGTRLYMAPEVLLHRDGLYLGTTYNENCDVWSLGVILYGEFIWKIWEIHEKLGKIGKNQKNYRITKSSLISLQSPRMCRRLSPHRAHAPFPIQKLRNGHCLPPIPSPQKLWKLFSRDEGFPRPHVGDQHQDSLECPETINTSVAEKVAAIQVARSE